MGDDVDGGGARRGDLVAEAGGALLDAARGGHGGGDDGGAGLLECVLNAVPVLEGGEGLGELDLGEAEEAVGENDGVGRRGWVGS